MSQADPFEYENEGETVLDPDFLCELCGFANVNLVDGLDGRSGAKCTNCGAIYINTVGAKE